MSSKNKHPKVEQARAPRWRVPAVAVIVVLAVAAAAGWWFRTTPTPEASGGTPRLVLDRDTIDLGPMALNTPARAVFTLTNAGDGALRITGVSRVRALEGC